MDIVKQCLLPIKCGGDIEGMIMSHKIKFRMIYFCALLGEI